MPKGPFPTISKLQKNKKFEFRPRYYDEVKDRIERQKEQVERDMEREKKLAKDPGLRIKEKMHEKWQRTNRADAQKQSNKRIIIIIAILALIAYYFLYR